MPIPIENCTNYKCEHCGKRSFRKCDTSRHERYCPDNPLNRHLCFMNCKHLERGEEEYAGERDEIKFTGTQTTFTCKLSGQKMYSYIAERKHHPVVSEPDTIRMPLVCDKYIHMNPSSDFDDIVNEIKMEPKKNVHHCFNCGVETDDYEEMPNGRKAWCCGSSTCEKELRSELRGMEQDARDRADDDGYSQYY